MRIHMPEIICEQGSVVLRARVEYAGRTEHLWYSVAADWGSYLTPERCDAFVVALLPVAMSIGEDVHVTGIMSEQLYYNLMGYYIKILRVAIPSLQPIMIVPERVDSSRWPRETTGVATGFSGGIDSFCVLADHLWSDVPRTFRVTHLFFNNVGSHGHGDKGRTLFEDRFKLLVPAAEAIGLPFIKIASNLDDMFPQNLDFQLTHTLRNISAVLAMQKLVSRYLYASAFKYEDCYTRATYDMAYTDPVAVHLLSTEMTECVSTGCQYSRVEKTKRVGEIALSRSFLNVCVRPNAGGNCSACWKCARTLLTLDILGTLHLYDRVFDLSKYHQIKRRYIAQVAFSRDPLLREIRQLAKERGFPFPFSSRVYHLKDVVARACRAAKKIVRSCRWRTISSLRPRRKAGQGEL
jgi:hypothetical protein